MLPPLEQDEGEDEEEDDAAAADVDEAGEAEEENPPPANLRRRRQYQGDQLDLVYQQVRFDKIWWSGSCVTSLSVMVHLKRELWE